MNVDILVIMAHPDDAELCCSGTILASINQGLTVGLVDLTRGELGTRGDEQIRLLESKNSSDLLELKFRDNLGFRDGFISDAENYINEIIKKIRKYSPKIIITNSKKDRHPDHENTSKIVKKACFLSGLVKYKTKLNNKNQQPHRPKLILYSIQNDYIEPDIIIDVSNFFSKKMESVKCFKSQFYDPESSEPNSFISSLEFLDFVESRSIEMGHKIGTKHGEGFTLDNPVSINSLSNII
ncbi:MAG: bacillithiol biosynthesis deacetylase BshB1 [Cytophagales bacterium]|nr:bacillithiol biosynthesis deacetylase BshB1 [Marinoscillum sp.]OUX26171.1 MAG: bacillithiol biosynthesis deacetylase BshB1 [Flammeovirgaceae bacterium TMED262]|tara:strand:+ start:843 stop:1559 length:717 start_codon:yes stop_codon:yes gene_type:complete